MKKIIYGLSMVIALSMVSSEADAQKVTTKSRKAKSTAVGAAAGAATGVAVSRNNSKGAVIGGVVGAGSGYLYGRHKDKKKGKKLVVKN